MASAPGRGPLPYALAALFALVVVALLWWLMSPSVDTTPSGRDIAELRAKRKAGKGKLRAVPTAQSLPEPENWLPLEEDPNIPVVTKTCKWIVTEERRNVPQWVMLDNLRDRSQLFVEDDIRCLSAAGVTPAILDYAERYIDKNKLQGNVGRPPGK